MGGWVGGQQQGWVRWRLHTSYVGLHDAAKLIGEDHTEALASASVC